MPECRAVFVMKRHDTSEVAS